MLFPDRKRIINFVLFQSGWSVCVVAGEMSWLVLTVTALILGIHGRWIVDDHREWLVMCVFAVLGILVDSLFGALGLLEFSGNIPLPLWLACLWLIFSTTLAHSLFWLHKHLLLAAVLAAISAPLSYFVGANLTSVSLNSSVWKSLLSIAAFWACFFPLGVFAMSRLQYRSMGDSNE